MTRIRISTENTRNSDPKSLWNSLPLFMYYKYFYIATLHLHCWWSMQDATIKRKEVWREKRKIFLFVHTFREFQNWIRFFLMTRIRILEGKEESMEVNKNNLFSLSYFSAYWKTRGWFGQIFILLKKIVRNWIRFLWWLGSGFFLIWFKISCHFSVSQIFLYCYTIFALPVEYAGCNYKEGKYGGK